MVLAAAMAAGLQWLFAGLLRSGRSARPVLGIGLDARNLANPIIVGDGPWRIHRTAPHTIGARLPHEERGERIATRDRDDFRSTPATAPALANVDRR